MSVDPFRFATNLRLFFTEMNQLSIVAILLLGLSVVFAQSKIRRDTLFVEIRDSN